MSAVAGAGAAAWVVPEILTAKPAAGATLSGGNGGGGTGGNGGNGGTGGNGGSPGGVSTSPATTSPATTGTNGVTTAAVTSPATSPGKSLAFTGLDIKRDAEIGGALIAGGWAMQHWASRLPEPAADGPTEAHEAGSAGDSA